MEKIGYIEKNNILLHHGLNSIDLLKDAIISYGFREIVEERNDVVQPVCAGVVITRNRKVLIVNKTTKSTGKISPEKNKTLLYIGGHLDFSDMSETNLQTFTAGMKRELSEEIGLQISNSNISSPIATYTPTTEKSAKHLGIIFPIIIENTFDTTFTDGKCKFVDIDSLKNITNFESWSEIILNEIVRKAIISERQL